MPNLKHALDKLSKSKVVKVYNPILDEAALEQDRIKYERWDPYHWYLASHIMSEWPVNIKKYPSAGPGLSTIST